MTFIHHCHHIKITDSSEVVLFPVLRTHSPVLFPLLRLYSHWEFGGQTGQESTAALLEADHCKLGLSHLVPHHPLLHRLPLSVLPSWRLLIGRGQKSNVFYWSADAFERRHHIRRLNSRLWFSLSNTCIDPVKTIFETSGLKLSYSKQKSGSSWALEQLTTRRKWIG